MKKYLALVTMVLMGCQAVAPTAPPAPTPHVIYVTAPPLPSSTMLAAAGSGSPLATSFTPSPELTPSPTAATPSAARQPTSAEGHPCPTPWVLGGPAIPRGCPVYATAASAGPTVEPTLRPLTTDLDFRWLKKGEFNCSYSSGRCWGMLVVPHRDCSSLYVEVSLEDAGGTVVGYTNDTVGAVRAGQRARLIFTTFEPSAEAAHPSRAVCGFT